MNLRPRCREWLPLATQQLRLRNLARVTGMNIEIGSDSDSLSAARGAVRTDGEVVIFYTLHQDKASEAFYTSEELPQRHQQQKWAEIGGDNDEVWRKSNAQCVCVKVWARRPPPHQTQAPQITETDVLKAQAAADKEPESTLTKRLANVCLTPHTLPRPPELLFSWGVYFSGLIPLAPANLCNCRPNCLIFHLNGEQFTSPAYITTEGLQLQLQLNNRPPLERPDNKGINSPPVSRNASPERELRRISCTRYAQIRCSAQDVRYSYSLQQLKRIQYVQRLKKQTQREIGEVVKEVARLSMPCITQNELHCQPRTTSLVGSGSPYAPNKHSMGRKLSEYLSEQRQIDPRALYQAQQLTKQIEDLRCKRRLLERERQSFTERIERHKEELQQMQATRRQAQEKLIKRRSQLERDWQELSAKAEERRELRETKRQIIRQVERRMSTLVIELQEIYNMQSVGENQLSICGITFPHMESYASDKRQIANAQLMENVSPLAVSAALGYVAHLTQMLAIIMDRPLRNPIIYEPSRTRIADEIKELTTASREFPLYTRSILPSQQTKYAIYLLKQNVAQLCFDITGRCDMKNTFGSLLELFNILRMIERSQRETRESSTEPHQRVDVLDSPKASALGPINGLTVATSANPELSQSHSSMDMNYVPLPTTATTAKDALLQLLPQGMSQALVIEGYASTQRICRSVGSYSDGEDDFRTTLEQNYSNSDSNIPLQTERS